MVVGVYKLFWEQAVHDCLPLRHLSVKLIQDSWILEFRRCSFWRLSHFLPGGDVRVHFQNGSLNLFSVSLNLATLFFLMVVSQQENWRTACRREPPWEHILAQNWNTENGSWLRKSFFLLFKNINLACLSCLFCFIKSPSLLGG